MTQRLDKINKQYNGMVRGPKSNKIKTKQVARTKWGVYIIFLKKNRKKKLRKEIRQVTSK